MANVIGQNLDPYVINQINDRQEIQGSGVNGYRSEQQISYLNTRNAWIKLASGVSVQDPALSSLGLKGISPGMDLAKKYVLFGGSSELASSSETLIQREKFVEGDFSVYENSEYGLVPMPGIISANVQTLNRGSIKKATVKLRANNKKQFDIIDVLYLRLGYTVLLEWGTDKFISGTSVKRIGATLVEDKVRFFSSAYESNKSYTNILGPINYYRNKYEGNYDALLGKISNFNWSFNPDGSYDIEITLISMGDVIESLKLNLSTDRNLTAFVLNASSGENTSTTETEGETDAETPDILEENKDANLIASMLWTWKWVNRDRLNYETYEDSLYIDLPNTSDPSKTDPKFVGAFLESTEGTITATTRTYEFYVITDDLFEVDTSKSLDNGGYGSVTRTFDSKNGPKEAAAAQQSLQQKLEDNGLSVKTIYTNTSRGGTTLNYYVTIGYRRIKQNSTSTESPIKDFGKEDACFLITNPQKQFYLRFGALLEFIGDNVIPKINTDEPNYNKKPPLINIDIDPSYGPYKNWMYSLPNQVSLDPRVCIVRNDVFKKQFGTAKVYSNLRPFRAVDYRSDLNPNKAYITNIYLNFNFIIETLNSNTDEKGNVSVYDFLKAVCDSLNTSLGGINNLEPVIDETSNTLKIIDSTPIPNTVGGKDYTLQLFGYNGAESTFVRKIDLKTAITPEYATMVTVGATAGGYVKGTEGTAFSKWNSGLTDRFKHNLLPGNEASLGDGENNEAVYNYSNKFLGPAQSYGLCYGFSGNLKAAEGEKKNLAINPDAIASNISVVTEYYKYLIASKQNETGGSIGFVPFKLNFTMDGLSGIKIYNVLHIDTRFLPKAYGESLNFIVTGVTHDIKDNDWETNIETTVIPKPGGSTGDLVISASEVAQTIEQGSSGINSSDAPLGANPPSSGWEILHPKYPSSGQAGKNIDLIIDVFKDYGVTNPYAIVGALSVIGKESEWIPQSEKMYYTKERLPEVWAAFSKTGKLVEEGKGKNNYNDLAKKYEKSTEKLANFVYGVNTSNPKGMRAPDQKDGSVQGNKVWGDGYKYRGRGFNQITWKSAYKRYGEEFGIDLVKYPDKLNEPKIAAKAAFVFFRNVFKSGGKSNPVDFMNSFTSVDEALVYFAKANSGDIRNKAETPIAKSREKRKYFDIVKN